MRLTTLASETIMKNRRCINLLAVEMDAHSGTIERNISENKDNGSLTTEAALRIIEAETGMIRSEILTKD